MADDKKAREKVKEILKKVTEKTTSEEMDILRKDFKDIIKDADPLIIAAAESDLMNEGHTIQDLMKSCDLHMELFKDAIRNPNLKVPEGHPIASFQEDHKNILDIMEKLIVEIDNLEDKKDYNDATKEIESMRKYVDKLMEAENHNVRQENTLFPILERHDIEQPPAIMWHEHTEMKEVKKNILKYIEEKDKYSFDVFKLNIKQMAVLLFEKFSGHTQKEENILYVTALKNITEEEWRDIKEECDNLGYFKP